MNKNYIWNQNIFYLKITKFLLFLAFHKLAFYNKFLILSLIKSLLKFLISAVHLYSIVM